MNWKEKIKANLFWGMACLVCLSLLGAVGCSDSGNNAPPPAPGYVQASLGGTQDEYFTRKGSRSIVKTSDGGFILTGSSDSKDGDLTANQGLFDLWVLKLSGDLKILWQKNLGGSKIERSGQVLQTDDGGCVLVGYTASNDGDVSGYHGGGDAWVVRLDQTGTVLWNRCYGGSRLDEATAVVQSKDGGFIVAGYSNSYDGDAAGNTGAFNAWIFKIDPEGNLIWQKAIGGSNQDGFEALTLTADEGLIAVGRTLSTDGDIPNQAGGGNLLVVRLDFTGEVQWVKAIGTATSEGGTAVQEASNGDLLVCGWSGPLGASIDALVVRLNAAGQVLWSKTYGGSQSDSAFGLALFNNQIFIAGESYSNDGDFPGSKGSSDIVVARLAENGALQGFTRLGGTDRESAGAILLVDPEKEPAFLIAGWTASRDGDVKANHGGRDIWLVKLRSDLDKD